MYAKVMKERPKPLPHVTEVPNISNDKNLLSTNVMKTSETLPFQPTTGVIPPIPHVLSKHYHSELHNNEAISKLTNDHKKLSKKKKDHRRPKPKKPKKKNKDKKRKKK